MLKHKSSEGQFGIFPPQGANELSSNHFLDEWPRGVHFNAAHSSVFHLKGSLALNWCQKWAGKEKKHAEGEISLVEKPDDVFAGWIFSFIPSFTYASTLLINTFSLFLLLSSQNSYLSKITELISSL